MIGEGRIDMKKSCLVALFLAPLVFSSCGTNTSKSVNSLSDFLPVAAIGSIKIAGTSLKTASSFASETTTSSSAASSASSAAAEATSSHNANLYLNEDFSITNEATNYIGFSKTYGTKTQYFLINGAKKSGFVTDDATTLNDQRAATKALIQKDYADLQAGYDLMKSYAGKSAQDFPNMSQLSLTMGVEGDAAGYTLITVTHSETDTVDTRIYLTLDQFEEGWVFTNYSKRVTTTSKNEKGVTTTTYSVAEYAIDVVSEYSAFNLSLSSYSLYLKDHNASEVSFPNGIPLTTI
jgi:hypothetical protein